MLESLLTTYGYPILVIGTFLEGETVLVLGGLAAHLGLTEAQKHALWKERVNLMQSLVQVEYARLQRPRY